jgi:putative FmdB family regulatory protein
MPFYEYECQACKYYAEVMQKISDTPLSRCPSCGKRRMKRLVSAPVFRLKGGGWYETDFKSDKETKRNLVGPEKEEAKPEAKPESKPESKEAKPEGKGAPESKEKGAAPEPKSAEGATSAGGKASTRRTHVTIPAARGRPAARGKRTSRTRAAAARKGRR